MVSLESIQEQLKKVGFNYKGWGRSEVKELPHILLQDEEIYDCVNGLYDGGFALILATDVRVLLVDKKPLNYLTVEDIRFDMINEIDYNHRLIGAYIRIATGNKEFRFTALNQQRLRKLIGHVQHCMAESKKKQSTNAEGQHQHLEEINQQLRTYLLAQYTQQQKLQEQLQKVFEGPVPLNVEPAKPTPQLSDYLFAQSLLSQHEAQITQPTAHPALIKNAPKPVEAEIVPDSERQHELLSDGLKEVFGHMAIDPVKVAISKLPTILHNRRNGLPTTQALKLPVVAAAPDLDLAGET